MKVAYTPLAFALGASAAVLTARDQCCFGLTASGGVSGPVGQLSDGQNRIAQTGGLDNQNGQYCLDNGAITDGNGRGCILTPPTTQFQCDSGAAPTAGFSVSNGDVAYNGNTQFYACPTGDNGGYNIYTQAVEGQDACVTVTLSTGGKCSGSGSASSAPAPESSVAPAPQSSVAPAPESSVAPAPESSVASAPESSVAPAPESSVAPAPESSVAPAPASSAPASSAPVSSAPAGPVTSVIWSTHYTTVTSCDSESAPASTAPASSAPASSAPASTAPASSAPASSAPVSSAPASSAPASSAPASSAPASSAPASSAPASSAPASSAPAESSAAPSGTAPASTSGSACQTSLSGAYQTPHAIIPVNKNQPSTQYGTQYNAYVGSGNSTVFNFDIPQSYSGKQCSVIFLFPEQSQLETSSFTQSGSGGLTFSQLSSAATLDLSYSSLPSVESQLNQLDSVTPGNSYVVSTGACAAGTTSSIEVSSTGSLDLEFFEDWNPSPIGVFITSC